LRTITRPITMRTRISRFPFMNSPPTPMLGSAACSGLSHRIRLPSIT
jgi:hypothetical protein